MKFRKRLKTMKRESAEKLRKAIRDKQMVLEMI